MRVLILGGTAEARALAAALVADQAVDGVEVVSSLAGRVSDPALPPGAVRIGGFGGADGLASYLRTTRIDAVVDATHPFAARISTSAAMACRDPGVPLLRLARPGWSGHPDAATWTWVSDVAQALIAGADAERPFLTTGRQSLESFLPWSDRSALVRVVEPPTFGLPSAWRLITSRGPYRPLDERVILAGHRTDLLLTKDSGGPHTAGKLDAARELGVPVVVIRRPPVPAEVTTVTDPAAVTEWVRGLNQPASRSALHNPPPSLATALLGPHGRLMSPEPPAS